MSHDSPTTRPPNRIEETFVVRFRPNADASTLAGRIEHVTSGSVARFESFGAMEAFIRRLLAGEGGE